MKRSKFTEAQIAFAIKQSETGTRVEEVCRKMGISEATFYNWKKKYGGLGVAELRRLRQLEEENAQLKKLVADLSLDKQMLQDVLKKSTEALTTPKNGYWSSFGLSNFPSQGMRGFAAEHIGLVL
jgi:putative transposase